MEFLRSSTLHLMYDLLPGVGSTLTNRIVNYLSFYLSYNGRHLYYSPRLHSHTYLLFHFTQQQQQQALRSNSEHVLAKMLMATQFQEQIVDLKGTSRLVDDLHALSFIDGKDIVESFLKVSCKDLRWGDTIEMAAKPLPAEKRRTVYVSHQTALPGLQQLAQMITQNPFYRLPNLNKVLAFAADPVQKLQLAPALESFCHEHSVRIKLLEKASTQDLIEYVYAKGKGKILIHENINFDKAIYDLQTPPDQLRTVHRKVVNPLNTRFMPQEVLLMTQRLPQESLATRQTEGVVMERMRGLLQLAEGEELIDPVNRIALSSIEKNYRHQKLYRSSESRFGFLLRRFVTQEVYALNRKSVTNTPFTNPKPPASARK